MEYVDFLSVHHKSTRRDYLARVNDADYPKATAATLAKKWDYDYWDGDRRINYGGYHYREGYWEKVAAQMIERYNIKNGDRILDIGCGKAFMLYDFTKLLPDLKIYGLDISPYAIEHAKPEVKKHLTLGNATDLPWDDNYFDFVYSIQTLHNLHNYDLEKALREMGRVAKNHKYLCVESYRNEVEKANLLYWQVTCEAFNTPEEWQWWFNLTGYDGDYSFIYFE